MTKLKAYRLPIAPRTKVEIAKRGPLRGGRELELLRRFVWCGGCRALLGSRGDYVYDHLIALELGGKDDLANLRPLCNECNLTKTALDQKLIAKAKRLAGETKAKFKRRRLPCGKHDRYKRTVDGRTVLRPARSG
jgi:hypothetical protein